MIVNTITEVSLSPELTKENIVCIAEKQGIEYLVSL